MTSPGASPSPCSRAFCTTSVKTSDRLVATSAGMQPKLPTRVIATLLREDATSRTIVMRRSATSSKQTTSSNPLDRISWTTAMAATRFWASVRALDASGEVVRRACRRSSAATVCRLFLTRWWISRIVASLVTSSRSRLRRSVTSRQVTNQPARCGRPAAAAGRAGASRPPGLELGLADAAAPTAGARAPARPARGAPATRTARTRRSSPSRSPIPAEPPEGAHRIGAGERDDAVGVHPQREPSPTRGVSHGTGLSPAIGNSPRGQHVHEDLGGLEVRVLQRARRADAHSVGVQLDDRDDPLAADDRDGMHIHGDARVQLVAAGRADLLRQVGLGDEALRVVGDLLADHVVLERGGARRRAALRRRPRTRCRPRRGPTGSGR